MKRVITAINAKTERKLDAGVLDDIRKRGRAIFNVCDDDQPFAYTIGNFIINLPELLLIGFLDGGGILHRLSTHMIMTGRPFEDGEIFTLAGDSGRKVRLVRASSIARAEYTCAATRYAGYEDYAVMQVVMGDDHGRYPGETGCQPPYCNIPVLRSN
jgi:hypothetical protein